MSDKYLYLYEDSTGDRGYMPILLDEKQAEIFVTSVRTSCMSENVIFKGGFVDTFSIYYLDTTITEWFYAIPWSDASLYLTENYGIAGSPSSNQEHRIQNIRDMIVVTKQTQLVYNNGSDAFNQQVDALFNSKRQELNVLKMINK